MMDFPPPPKPVGATFGFQRPGGPGFWLSPAQITMLVVCVVSAYFVVGFYGKSVESYRISQRAEAVQRQIAQLEAQNRVLQQQVAELSTDAYVETAARDKLNLAKPGDHSLVVVPAQDEVATVEGPPSPDTPPARELGHLSDWLALFFGDR